MSGNRFIIHFLWIDGLASMEKPAGICRMGSLVGPCGNNFREAISKYCYCLLLLHWSWFNKVFAN